MSSTFCDSGLNQPADHPAQAENSRYRLQRLHRTTKSTKSCKKPRNLETYIRAIFTSQGGRRLRRRPPVGVLRPLKCQQKCPKNVLGTFLRHFLDISWTPGDIFLTFLMEWPKMDHRTFWGHFKGIPDIPICSGRGHYGSSTQRVWTWGLSSSS